MLDIIYSAPNRLSASYCIYSTQCNLSLLEISQKKSQNSQKDDNLVNTARIVYSQKGIAF